MLWSRKVLVSLKLTFKTDGKTGETLGVKLQVLAFKDTAAGTGLGESQGKLQSDGLS